MGKSILIISSKSADFGGVEYHVLDLVKGFFSKNKVFVMCPKGALVDLYKSAGAEVLTVAPNAPYDFGFALYVKKFCKSKNIDIVHCHEIISAQGMLGAFLAGVKVRIWHVHTPFLYWKHRNLVIKITKSILNWITNFFIGNFFATVNIALTQEIKKHRKTFELVIFKPIIVIPNAVDLAYFSRKIDSDSLTEFKKSLNIPENRIIIGNMSRTSAEKGQDLLLQAFNTINKKFPNKYFLLIAGGGELESEYKKYCDLNFKDSYLITGKFSNEDKVNFLKIMDFFVFPSLAEGFGYVLVEAIACKIPVISSDLPVLQNVGGKNLYYFKSGDAKDLEKVLEQVLVKLDEETKQKNIDKTFQKIQEYSFENFIKNYNEVYKI